MPQLSLAMIVKNEEKYLEECLNSVKEIIDEIIIVDTGSTDNTIEIAKKFGALIYNFDWTNDFAEARNYALSKTSGNWILYLDADERVSPQSLKEISKIKASKENAGYFCAVKSLDNENNRDNSMRYVRLFRNVEGIRFTGKVHEQISASLSEHGLKLKNSDILINHLGYNIPLEEKQAKAGRNLFLLQQEFEKSKSGYYAFQLANTYFVLGDSVNSEKYFRIAADSDDLTIGIKAECFTNLALKAHKDFNPQLALEYLSKSIELNKEQPFSYFLAGKINLQIGNMAIAEEYCKKALSVNKRALAGLCKNDLVIYLDNEEIIGFGLFLAYNNGNKDSFQFYLKEYQDYLKEKNSDLSKKIVTVVTKLISKEELNNIEEIVLLSLINRYNADFFYALLENRLNTLKEDFINALYDRFRSDKGAIRILSKYHFENNNIEKAIEVLELNYDIVITDPSIILYLISFYLTLGNFDKAEQWLDLMEDKFQNLPQITPVVKKLKEKILLIKNN